jgi:hypothetical protein
MYDVSVPPRSFQRHIWLTYMYHDGVLISVTSLSHRAFRYKLILFVKLIHSYC